MTIVSGTKMLLLESYRAWLFDLGQMRAMSDVAVPMKHQTEEAAVARFQPVQRFIIDSFVPGAGNAKVAPTA